MLELLLELVPGRAGGRAGAGAGGRAGAGAGPGVGRSLGPGVGDHDRCSLRPSVGDHGRACVELGDRLAIGGAIS